MLEFDTLIGLQREAEERGWGTRWSSVEALRVQVANDGELVLQTFMRQKRGQDLQAIRCMVLFSRSSGEPAGAVATLDVSPERIVELPRVDRDLDVRSALSFVFRLASGGIGMVPKD